MTVDLPTEIGPVEIAPRVLVSTELAEDALEAGNNWTAATKDLRRPYAPTFAVTDDVDAEASGADWTVVAVDHVSDCASESDPEPRGCTIGGPTVIRERRGPLVFESTVESPVKRIEIRRGLGWESVSTIMHEFGHALDLEHLPAGLMNPDRSHAERVNPLVDAAALALYEQEAAR